MSRTKITFDQDELTNLYLNKNLSPYKLGEMFGCSFSTITNRLREYGVGRKDNSIARQRYKRNDFSNNRIEKAYMLGFRLGDLNVYKTSPTSKFIIVRCHTTTIDQVKLISNLFKQYGQVTISQNKDGSYHINCYLNDSFNFLLDKSYTLKEFKKKDMIYSFIAGYIDAKGYLGLNQGRARLKIDSYDDKILEWIHKKLLLMGIQSKLRIISVCETKRNYGKSLWRLNVNNADSLLNVVGELKKYCKHNKRISQILSCKQNLLARRNR